MMWMKWSEEEDLYLEDNYLHKTFEEMAKELNRTKGSIAGRMGRIGLSKNDDDIVRPIDKTGINTVFEEAKNSNIHRIDTLLAGVRNGMVLSLRNNERRT